VLDGNVAKLASYSPEYIKFCNKTALNAHLRPQLHGLCGTKELPTRQVYFDTIIPRTTSSPVSCKHYQKTQCPATQTSEWARHTVNHSRLWNRSNARQFWL